jgi:O-antigen/teichoic acid export membrane protein
MRGLKSTLHQYRRYPIYSTPESFFNTAGAQIPIILVAAHGGNEAGFLMLAMQLMATPISLLGGAISQVYVSRAPQSFKEGNLAVYTRSIMLRLLKVGLLPFSIIGILAPWVVPFIFGSNWSRVGEITTWILPWMILQYIVSPVSMVLHIAGYQIHAMGLQIFGLILRTSIVIFAIYINPEYIVQFYALGSALFYAIYYIVVNAVVLNNLNISK